MKDFTIPDEKNPFGLASSPANFIRPQKMPLSSMAPTIMTNKNQEVELVLGAAGGSKIISSVAYVLLRYLFFNEPIATAVQKPRIHDQLAPMRLEYERGFSEDIIDGLREKGHEMYLSPPDSGFAALTAIARSPNQITPVFDRRRGGSREVIDSPPISFAKKKMKILPKSVLKVAIQFN